MLPFFVQENLVGHSIQKWPIVSDTQSFKAEAARQSTHNQAVRSPLSV